MKIFISSVIRGLEAFRDAAARGASTLRHEVKRAEDFGASPDSPQRVCLSGVRDSDLVILLIGARYGEPQGDRKLSPTHEEYLEARERGSVLVFVKTGVDREVKQEEFLRDVQRWTSGHYSAEFATAAELQDAVIRALHDFELSKKTGNIDEVELLQRARGFIPLERSLGYSSLSVVVTGAPRQQVLRPAALEAPALSKEIQKEALFGAEAVLNPSAGSEVKVNDGRLVIRQQAGAVTVDQIGSVCVTQPAQPEGERRSYVSAVIEEDVQGSIERALRFSAWLLDHIDSNHRLAWVAPTAAIVGAGHLGWLTRAARNAKPNSISMGMRGDEAILATLTPGARPRAALKPQASEFAEDLMVLLRRQMKV
jgi:hypothetical protein